MESKFKKMSLEEKTVDSTLIYDGKIPDAKTQCAVLHVWSRFCQKGEGR